MIEVVYRPRKPKASPLYQSIADHFSEFESVYGERYQKRYGVLRDVVREVVYKYLGCGDLRKGFARIKCKDCKHEVLLSFSCKGRYFPVVRPVEPVPILPSEKSVNVWGMDHGKYSLPATPQAICFYSPQDAPALFQVR